MKIGKVKVNFMKLNLLNIQLECSHTDKQNKTNLHAANKGGTKQFAGRGQTRSLYTKYRCRYDYIRAQVYIRAQC